MAMMTAEPLVEPVTSDGGNGDDDTMSHYTCCLDDRGLCGTRVTSEVIPDDGVKPDCVVCRAMEDQPCEVTCHPWLGGAS